jgi:hypothetical protein
MMLRTLYSNVSMQSSNHRYSGDIRKLHGPSSYFKYDTFVLHSTSLRRSPYQYYEYWYHLSGSIYLIQLGKPPAMPGGLT